MNWLFLAQLRPFIVLAGGSSLLLNLALLMPALYTTQLFDRVFASRSVETLAMLSLLVLLALLFAFAMDRVRGRALVSAGAALEARLSAPALSHVLREAVVATPSTDALRDIAQLRGFLGGGGIQAVFDAPWLPVFLLVIGLMDPLLGLAAGIGAALLVAVAWAGERLTRAPAERAALQARVAARHAQSLSRNAEAIAGMGMGLAALAGWQRHHAELLSTQAQLAKTSGRLGAVARMLRQALQVGLLGLGAWLVVIGHASPGVMVAATLLLGRALQPVEQLAAGWKSWVQARAAWARLSALPLQPPGASAGLPAPQGRLDVERLVYAIGHSRVPLIKAVSFSVDAGESLGILGASASGKTTLLRLLLGIRRPQSGAVRLDGADIASWNRDALGAHVGYLPQDVELFAGTVAENIARLGAVDMPEVVQAARRAQAHEMILRLPDGYDTQVGEAGSLLSGGQRQRIALARALYGEPRLVVLDEPNASLDADGEAALAVALCALKAAGVTVVVVGHRPGLMAGLDKLAVLKDGALEAFGPAAAVLQRLQAAPPQVATLRPARAPRPEPETSAQEAAA